MVDSRSPVTFASSRIVVPEVTAVKSIKNSPPISCVLVSAITTSVPELLAFEAIIIDPALIVGASVTNTYFT